MACPANNEPIRGLSSAEVERRLREYGLNLVPEKRESVAKLFVKKFTGITPFTIEAAAAFSYALGRFTDFAIMISLLLVNAVLGVIHEHRAERAVEMLKSRLKIVVLALRDGRWVEVPSENLVPGDVIKLEIGGVVPADCKVLQGSLLVDESTLTGESLPVEKSAGDAVYAGTVVMKGSAIAEVTATGGKTRYGRTVELVQMGKPRLIIEEVANSITEWLIAVDSFFIVLVALRLIQTRVSIMDLLPFTLTLLIASIPIALPAMTTIALALGSYELAKEGVIVRRLEAVEAAAMMDTLCLDKTGTITENKLYVKSVIPVAEGYSEKDILLLSLLATEENSRSPIDAAINAKAAEMGVSRQGTVEQFTPFDPERKRTEAMVTLAGKRIKVVMGAPQVLLEMDAAGNRALVQEKVKELGESGERPLAVGVDDGMGFRVVGILGLYDRPRPDSPVFIAKIRSMGVKPVMITGDNVYVARSVATSVGLGSDVVSLREVKSGDLGVLVDKVSALAEVLPEDKYTIVAQLQANGHVVGMTGDGVNDAPALKKADLGIAVCNATDVAKSAASVVLTQPGLTNIASIIELGRVIYRRIVVWAVNKIVKTFQIVYFVAISTLLLGLPILTPTHMILMLFLYDFVTLSISTDRLRPSLKPERWNARKLVKVSTILGGVKITELFGALYIGFQFGLSLNQLRTFMFYVLLLSGLFNLLNFREIDWFWSSKPSRVLLISILIDATVGTAIVALGWLVDPLPLNAVALGLLYSISVTLVLTDAAKVLVYRLEKFS